MKESIRLSEKHGLNPTIPLCPYCEKPKNQIAMLGAEGDKLARALGRADGEMPMHCHLPGDVHPCEECLETKKDYVFLFSAEKTEEGTRLTGRFAMARRSFLESILNDPSAIPEEHPAIMAVDDQVFDSFVKLKMELDRGSRSEETPDKAVSANAEASE